MLSAQRDRLRELADRLDGLAPESAALIRSAADTIWELRCKLNDEQDENAKLREQLEYDRQTSRSRLESIDRLNDENDKLRELVRDVVLLAGVNGVDVTEMRLHAHGGDWRTVWERMRELGVADHD